MVQAPAISKTVCDYVPLNPARAPLVPADQPLRSYAWSSWPAYLLGRSERESAEEKAEGIIAAELKRRGWTEAELPQRPKGDPTKVQLAQRLRAETVQTVAWISQRLPLGSRAYANHLLWRAKQEQPK